MNKALTDLIRISNTAGKDATFVQGGGGNTSVKTDDGKFMYIKASGTALKAMTSKKGWRRINLNSVLAIIQDELIKKLQTHKRETEVVNRLLLACDDNVTDGSRPSVEAHLHGYLDKYVIHLHPNAVGAYVNAKNGKDKLERLFKDRKLPFLWVPCAEPGFMLANKIVQLLAEYKKEHGSKPQILFLEKHGLFVTTNSANSCLGLTRKIIAICDSKLIHPKAGKNKAVSSWIIEDTALCIRKAFYDAAEKYCTVTCFNNDTIASFMRNKNSKSLLRGTLTPDELIYSNGPAMWVEKPDARKIAARIKSLTEKGQKYPAAFLVKGIGLFVVGKKKIAITVRDVVTSSLFIRSNAYRLGGIACLSKRQKDFINKWESETFRKTLALGVNKGDLEDRIALVTGAGSGLGRSIAIGLARAGAMVAVGDIDVKAAEQTKEIIRSEISDSHVQVVNCDVTDESSVEDTFGHILEEFGGLDILVNAAGVAPAAALVNMPTDKWRFALDVNLTGYFLMAKHAAKIMICQGMGGSIINISSKTGLDASKNNTPYNAAKSAQLHMARGWAIELGKHGIRVNSVCPCNVFEDSKIWNPEYIKTCAKKYGIKPQEVIPYYVNKTMLQKEIKGTDIADSVLFLVSDKAKMITGQTLVVDAGQAMVR